MSQNADQKFELAMAAIGGAIANLRVALTLIAEMKAGQQGEQPPKAEQDEGPKMFRRKAPTERPTTAVGAESQQSEGLDNGSR